MINSKNAKVYKLNGSNKKRPSNLKFYFSCHKGTSASLSFVAIKKNIQRKLDECCTKPVILSCRDPLCREITGTRDGLVYKTTEKCGNRICQKDACVRSRISRTKRKYVEKVKQMKTPRFMTLTYAGHHELSFSVKNEIDGCWKTLSQYLRRKNAIFRYVKALELVQKEDGYYYHLHLIYDGKYIPFKKLQEKWLEYTKTTHRVSIERVKSRFKAVNYVTKYICKGSQIGLKINDFIKIRKMQFFSSYGKFDPITIDKLEILLCPICGGVYKYDFVETEEERKKIP